MWILQQLWVTTRSQTGTMFSITPLFNVNRRALTVCGLWSLIPFVFLILPPHTVRNGHHGTEVHLTGHRLPGALLTDSQMADSYSHIKGIPCSSGGPFPIGATKGHWRLSSIPLTSLDHLVLWSLWISSIMAYSSVCIQTHKCKSFTPFLERSLNQSPASWRTYSSTSSTD